jgi:hypothetical protein
MNTIVSSVLNEINKASGNTVQTGESPIHFIDGDTTEQDGKRYRVIGYDTPEIDRIINGKFKVGTAGGEMSFNVLSGLANKYGFNKMVPKIDERGKIVKDQGGKGNRILADIQNDKGESWKSFILSNGLESPDQYASAADNYQYEFNSLQRERDRMEGTYVDNDIDNARDAIDLMKLREGYKQNGFKREALNERELQLMKNMGLGGYFQSNNVALRTPDRYINNKAKHYASDTFEKTMVGMKEAGYGVMSMIGDTTGSEWLSGVGEEGAIRVRRQLEPYADTLHSFRDVKSFANAFEYVANSLAMSIPYIAITMGALAAAPATAGSSLAIPASMYAGQTYNEMDENNKSVSLAAISGILQTALDIVGVRFIVKPGAATADVLKMAVDTLVKGGMTTTAAKAKVATASRTALAGLAGDVTKIAGTQIASKQAFLGMVKKGGLNTLVEGGTEGLQEATAYIAANNRSVVDGTFDWEKFYERTSEAVVAGGVLGAGFTIPSAAHNAGAWADVKYKLLPTKDKNDALGDQLAKEEADIHTARGEQVPDNSTLAGKFKARYQQSKVRQSTGGTKSKRVHMPDGTIKDITLNKDGKLPDFADRVGEHEKARKGRSTFESIVNKVSKPMALFVGANHDAFTNEVLRVSSAARAGFSMIGGNRWNIFSGQDFISGQQLDTASYKAHVPDAKVFYNKLNPTGKRLSRKRQSAIGANFYKLMRSAIDPVTNKFNPDLIETTGPNANKIFKGLNPKEQTELKDFLVTQQAMMETMAATMHRDQTLPGFNKDLKPIDNYLLVSQMVDKHIIRQNPTEFLNLLVTELGMTQAEAKNTLETFMDNPEISEIGEAFSVTKGGILPGSHHKRKYSLSTNKAFEKFMQQDLYENLSHHAKQAARYKAHQTFLGNNAEVYSQVMNEMEAEGVPTEVVNEIAYKVKNIFDASSGNYNRPTTAAGKHAIKLQKNLLSLAMFASLPLSTITSFVEAGMTNMGLTSEQIFGKKGEAASIRPIVLSTNPESKWDEKTKKQVPIIDPITGKQKVKSTILPYTPEASLRKQGREFGQMLWDGMDEVVNLVLQREGSVALQKGTTKMAMQPGQTAIKDLGFKEWSVGAATVTGVTEVNHAHQFFYQSFFKWIGLTGWTDFMRSGRAASAGDLIYDHMETIRKGRVEGGEKTNAVAQAESELRALGMRVDGIDNSIDKYFDALYGTLGVQYNTDGTTIEEQGSAHQKALDEVGKEIRVAYYNFINQGVPLPNAANRPIFYSNPHYALFLQFNGFISAFTANQIPRLWAQYVARGTPAMKYNAFATMTTMIMLGFASQYLKDLIKYGGRSPYLDDAEYFQRGLRSSGLMGTLERAYDQINPLYAQRSDSKSEWVFNTAVGESPALGYVARGFKAGQKIAGGDVGSGVKIGMKLVPGAGPFNRIGDNAGEFASAWNFNTEGK